MMNGNTSARNRLLSVLPVLLVASMTPAGRAEPDMLVNSCLAVVGDDMKRWSEGSILPLTDKDILVAVTGYPKWNHDDSPANLYGFWSHDGGKSWTPQ
jgi:hypothetical protein